MAGELLPHLVVGAGMLPDVLQRLGRPHREPSGMRCGDTEVESPCLSTLVLPLSDQDQ